MAQGAAGDGTEVNIWVAIKPDDTCVIRIARSEMGQGTITGLAQLEDFLEMGGVSRSYAQDAVCLSSHCVRLGHFRDGADHFPHPVWRHSALAVDLHEGLDRPAQCGRLDLGRKAPDDAGLTKPIDPSFGGRCGTVRHSARAWQSSPGHAL